jgi:hypothetical protein
MQLLATPDLHQLLITAVAWLSGLLHQEKQGVAGVPVERVLHCLSNSSAAAAVTLDDSSSSDSEALRSSAGSSSSSSSRVPPHHSRVLELLQVAALDPQRGSGSAHSHQLRSALDAFDAADAAPNSVANRLSAALLAAALCLGRSRKSSSGGDAGPWRQLAPAVASMLVSVVRVVPVGRVGYAAVSMLRSVWMEDRSAVAESEAVVDILVNLGPAVLYAVLLQQQQQSSRQTQEMHHMWAVLVMAVVSSAGRAGGE